LAHEVLGQLMEAEGNIPEAIAHYKEAIRLRPDFGKAHLELGTVLARKRDRTGAAAEFRAAQSDPDPQIRERANEGLAGVGAN
jgi:Flp pilus assembly protein TadD